MSHENERRKDMDIMLHLYRLCENINSWRIRSRLRRVMRQQASIPSSATVAVQRHQVKSLWSKPRLKLGPTPPWTRNNQWEGASAMFSFDGTYFKCKAKFSAWDIFSIFINSFFTSRDLPQPPFFQAAGKVTLFVHTSILAFLIEGKKEIKVLHKALSSRALISPSRLIK